MTMTINDLYIELRRQFRAADISMGELEARELAAFVSGADKHKTADWGYRYLDPDTVKTAEEMAARRLEGEPLAYILGEWDFFGRTFVVNKNVLIPRSDTEPLCQLAIEDAKTLESPKVLDLCCGSGCIGLTLAAEVPDARIAAVDLSEDALIVARENARRLGVTARYFSVCGDALGLPDAHLGTFDLMLCNPPYITAAEMEELDNSVVNYEPRMALYGGEDGLDFYRNIARHWVKMMNPGGRMYFECGYRQAADVAEIFSARGMHDIFLAEDLSGIQRIVVVKAKM
ncbi:MAG: peptide chain release factor N(5)-glutamine methyltransferase [Butyricicoccus sp.]|nr:peptide chain release factor N(5)-glutamine methyltransferase [Butyricicoccus sp.]